MSENDCLLIEFLSLHTPNKNVCVLQCLRYAISFRTDYIAGDDKQRKCGVTYDYE